MKRAKGTDPTERTEVVEGAGVLLQLGERTRALGARALLVTDAGLVASGHVVRAEAILRAAGLAVARFDGVHEDPTTDDVTACLARAREFEPDVLVGFGGGSPIDVAKGVNLLLCCGGEMGQFEGRHAAAEQLLPLVAVPTTAGTGSEVQSFALIAEPGTHRKMACGDPQLAPRVALLDPELCLTLPPFVTACTGLDAIGHAVESAVTRAGNAVSTELAERSFALSVRAFPHVLAEPSNLGARGDMLRAAALAGRAIENSMLGAAHSMANPLSVHFGLPHGQAVAMALPGVVAFNAQDPEVAPRYAPLTRAAGLGEGPEAVGQLVARLSEFLDLAGLPKASADCGVTAEDSARLAREAAAQWTARHNPRPLGTAEFEALFERLRRGRVGA